eukprot:2549776-Amphidinium_carterae.1
MYLEENPALSHPVESDFLKCLLCSFAGSKETLGLCSVCYRKHQDDPTALEAARSETARASEAGSANEPDRCSGETHPCTHCGLNVEYGAPDFASTMLSDLFPDGVQK